MLISIGLITLVGFIGLTMIRPSFPSWKGQSSDSKGVNFELKLEEHRKSKIWIAVSTNSSLQFTLKKETALDRLAKHTGLSSEIQAGAPTFDDSLYIISDDPQLEQLLRGSKEIVELANSIVKSIECIGCKLKEFKCYKGRLWIQCGSTFGIDEFMQSRLISEIVSKLERISQSLDSSKETTVIKKSESFYLKSKFLTAVASGMALNGIFFLWMSKQELPVQLISSTGLFWSAIALGVFITFMLCVLTVVMLRPSSITHIILLKMLLIGTFGACTNSYTFLSAINREWGEQSNTQYTVEIHQREKANRGGYFFVVGDWTKVNAAHRIKVPFNLYSKAKNGDKVIIFIRDGYLSWAWIEDIIFDTH